MTPPANPAQEWGDLDLDEDIEDLDDEQDGPVPIACQWGMPGWCSTGRHHRCYFTTDAETIKTSTYGHHDGHVWTCPCPCHANQGYPPCPHPDHGSQDQRATGQTATVGPVQVNLF